MRTAVFFALAWALATCMPAVTPGYVVDCAAACDNGRELACEWAAPTPEGATCETVCSTVEATGYDTVDPACLAAASSCAEAERCAR